MPAEDILDEDMDTDIDDDLDSQEDTPDTEVAPDPEEVVEDSEDAPDSDSEDSDDVSEDNEDTRESDEQESLTDDSKTQQQQKVDYEARFKGAQRSWQQERDQRAAAEKRLQELEDHIVALAEAKKSSFDRLLEALEERPQVVDKVLGTLAPAIQGFLGRMVPAQPQIAVQGTPRGMAVPPPHQEEAAADELEEEPGGGGVDFNPAIQATAVLAQAGFSSPELLVESFADAAIRFRQAGFEDPAQLIQSLVQFAEGNPDMARSLLTQLPS
jgi:hypothetical protein